MEWLSGGDGLLVIAEELDGSPAQIWHVAYPGGMTRRITNDLNNYRDLERDQRRQDYDCGPGGKKSKYLESLPPATPVTRRKSLTQTSMVWMDWAWAPDGKLVYTLNTGDEEIFGWSMQREPLQDN